MILTQADITLFNYMKIHIHLIWFFLLKRRYLNFSQFPGFLSADALQRLLLAVLNQILLRLFPEVGLSSVEICLQDRV